MNLRNECLGHVPIAREVMQGIYERVARMTEKELRVRLKAVCLSHERIQAELEGCEILLVKNAKKIKQEPRATKLPRRLCYQDYHEYSQIAMCRDAKESYEAAIVMAKELHRFKAAIPDTKGA